MRHYEIGNWVDLVRGLVSQEQRIEMDTHRTSCSECSATFEFLRKVAAAAQEERTYEAATEALLPAARRAFTAQRGPGRLGDRVADALRTLVAHLTYDSSSDLRPAGARSGGPTTHQMLYEAGDFCLDLRFDRATDSRQVTLVGQIANRKDPALQLATLPVSIVSNDEIVAEVSSNRFGEFSLDYTPRPGLRLRVPITEAGIQVEVPLKRTIGTA
jgi:hypothetical protein